MSSLKSKIKFDGYRDLLRNEVSFSQSKAWYINTLQQDFPNDWESKIQKFDNDILERKDNQAMMVAYINTTINAYIIKHIQEGKAFVELSNIEKEEKIARLKKFSEDGDYIAKEGIISTIMGGRDISYLPVRYTPRFIKSGEQDAVMSDMTDFSENQKKITIKMHRT